MGHLPGRTGWVGVALVFAMQLALGGAAQAAALRSLDQFVTAQNLTPKAGLFTLYQQPETGAIYMAVKRSQIGKEFLYIAHIENGFSDVAGSSGDVGDDIGRGRVLQNRIFKIVHLPNEAARLEFIDEGSNLYFDPASPLARSQPAFISPEVIAVVDIAAATPDESVYLIRIDEVFGRDARGQLPRQGAGTYSGESRLVSIRNYPSNSDFDVDYIYNAGAGATSPLNLSMRVHHSLIELADSDYTPRADDYRVGYIPILRTDVTSTSRTPFVDVIARWNLKKADPQAALSEPVKPITFWIENTTPLELRESVRQGILAWNKAFESAGFKNAIRAEIQPDKPDWSTGDIHHNVVRWVSSREAGYYGLTWLIANPRSGEILNATVMLDYWEFRRRVQDDKLFAQTANADRAETAEGLDGAPGRQSVTFGLATLGAGEASPVEVSRLFDEAVRWTVTHEVGHALGLDHNFRASAIRPFAELQATDQTKYPLSGSVMDYAPVNIARKGQRQGAFFMTEVGPYDVWAIQYGYTPSLSDPAAEAARVKALLARSAEPQLAFGSPGDAPDLYRGVDRGADPRVMQWDLSSDPVAWASDRMQLINETTAGLKAQFVKPGQSYQELTDAFTELRLEKARAGSVLARTIGGVYVERTPPDEPGAKPPFTVVPAQTQKAAMAALRTYIFAPDAFELPGDLLRYLQIQRRGPQTTPDPDIQRWALATQNRVLAQLLAPRVLARITNSRSYGNDYTVDAVMSDLTDAVFAADLNGNVNTFRQALQTNYVETLCYMLLDDKAGYDAVARAAILKQLRSVREAQSHRLLIRLVLNLNAETVAHREHLRLIISRTLFPD